MEDRSPDLARAPFRRGPFEDLPREPRLSHPYAKTTARTARIDSVPFGTIELHYREWGSGPPLLLVHGLMTSSYSWRYVLDGLGAHFRLVIPDLPGSGRSAKPDRPYTARAVARALGELQRAIGLRGCPAIGNSLGGYICMWLALEDAGAFSRLVNVHSPGIPDLRLRALHAALGVPGVARALAWWIRRDPLRWAHRHVHYHDETLKSLEEAHEYGDPLATIEGSRALVRYLADAVAPREMREFVSTLEEMRARGQAFPCPLLLVYADEDPMVPPRIGEALSALLPGVPLARLSRTSHFAHVDSPERLLEQVTPFLAHLRSS
ncbi:alpha/beta hydrolase [bacterium]|nr:alpha/beta hydrolase [bacterium]